MMTAGGFAGPVDARYHEYTKADRLIMARR
jgi:hypothetical protein